MAKLKSRLLYSRRQARQKMEKIHGKIPRTHVVHHIDENPFNNDISNLCIMGRAEHSKHHCKKEKSMAKKKKRADPRMTFCMPPQMKDQLVEYSKNTGLAEAEVLRRAISEFFERQDWKNKTDILSGGEVMNHLSNTILDKDFLNVDVVTNPSHYAKLGKHPAVLYLNLESYDKDLYINGYAGKLIDKIIAKKQQIFSVFSGKHTIVIDDLLTIHKTAKNRL
jgi:hypothetical protein